MCDLWKELGPPAYVSVAAYLGLTSKKNKAGASDDYEGLARLINSG